MIVFIAETDPDFVAAVAKTIRDNFHKEMDEGLLDVISPPAEFYPNWSTLKQTLGDPLERVN